MKASIDVTEQRCWFLLVLFSMLYTKGTDANISVNVRSKALSSFLNTSTSEHFEENNNNPQKDIFRLDFSGSVDCLLLGDPRAQEVLPLVETSMPVRVSLGCYYDFAKTKFGISKLISTYQLFRPTKDAGAQENSIVPSLFEMQATQSLIQEQDRSLACSVHWNQGTPLLSTRLDSNGISELACIIPLHQKLYYHLRLMSNNNPQQTNLPPSNLDWWIPDVSLGPRHVELCNQGVFPETKTRVRLVIRRRFPWDSILGEDDSPLTNIKLEALGPTMGVRAETSWERPIDSLQVAILHNQHIWLR
jgi:hypothetical protein